MLQLLFCALLISLLLAIVLCRFLSSNKLCRALLMLFFMITLSVQFSGISGAMIGRSVFGDFSVVSMALLVLFAHRFMLFGASFRLDTYTAIFLTVLGGVLFICMFSVVKFDVYRFGFAPIMPMSIMVFWSLVGIRYTRLPAVLTICVMSGYYFHILDSTNIFDYVIDAPLFVVCLILIIGRILSKFKRSKN